MLYIEYLRHNENLTKRTITTKKKFYACNLYAERAEAGHAPTTYKVLAQSIGSVFSRGTHVSVGPLDAISQSPRHPEAPSDALTAETPRLGGNL
jgi:hypothetical protein